MYSLSRHWLLVVLAACPSVGLPYNCHSLLSSCQYQCHLVLKTWPAAATTDDTVDSRWILGDVQFTADRERNISSLFIDLYRSVNPSSPHVRESWIRENFASHRRVRTLWILPLDLPLAWNPESQTVLDSHTWGDPLFSQRSSKHSLLSCSWRQSTVDSRWIFGFVQFKTDIPDDVP